MILAGAIKLWQCCVEPTGLSLTSELEIPGIGFLWFSNVNKLVGG